MRYNVQVKTLCIMYLCSIFVALQTKSSPVRLTVDVSKSHTIRHTQTTGRTLLEQWSVRRTGRYLHNIQQIEERNIQALSGIRTCDLSDRAIVDVILRPHDYWLRPIMGLYWFIINSEFVCVWDPLWSSLNPVRPLRETFFCRHGRDSNPVATIYLKGWWWWPSSSSPPLYDLLRLNSFYSLIFLNFSSPYIHIFLRLNLCICHFRLLGLQWLRSNLRDADLTVVTVKVVCDAVWTGTESFTFPYCLCSILIKLRFILTFSAFWAR
jgi:hypothetical protein